MFIIMDIVYGIYKVEIKDNIYIYFVDKKDIDSEWIIHSEWLIYREWRLYRAVHYKLSK